MFSSSAIVEELPVRIELVYCLHVSELCGNNPYLTYNLPFLTIYIPRYTLMAGVAARLSVGQSGSHPLHLITY